MRIIKHGCPKKKVFRFKCDYCGCEFEKDKGESHIYYNTPLEQLHDGRKPYFTLCPDCGKYAEGETVEVQDDRARV